MEFLTPAFPLFAMDARWNSHNKMYLKSIFFWDMTPCSALSATCLLAASLNYSTTLTMEAIRSSETSGTTQRTTRRHIPEEDTLQNHRCENLKSYTVLYVAFKCKLLREVMRLNTNVYEENIFNSSLPNFTCFLPTILFKMVKCWEVWIDLD
jgi:hypothetical protein